MIKATTIMLLVLSAAPAFAEGCWECGPDPEPPVVVDPPKTDDGETEYTPYNRIYYSVCTCDELKTAWGFESLEGRTSKARMQCEQRRERISCPMKWK